LKKINKRAKLQTAKLHFICQNTSTMRRDLFSLRVKLPPVISSPTTQR